MKYHEALDDAFVYIRKNLENICHESYMEGFDKASEIARNAISQSKKEGADED